MRAETAQQSLPGFWRGWVCLAAIFFSAIAWSFNLISFLHAKEAILITSLPVLGLLCIYEGVPVFRGISAWLPLWLAIAAALLFTEPAVPAYAVEEAALFLPILLFMALNHDLIQHPGWQARIRRSLVYSADAVALLALGQYAGALHFLFPVFEEYTQPMYSVFGNQDLLGGYLALGVVLRVHRLTRGRKSAVPEQILLALNCAVLVLSGSRSAWLACAAGMLLAIPWCTFFSRMVVGTLFSAGIGVTAGIIGNVSWFVARVSGTLGAGDIGGRSRLWFWDSALLMIQEHFPSGVGPGNFRFFSPWYQGVVLLAPGGENRCFNQLHTVHAHSELLEFIAETGIIAVIALIWMLFLLRKGRGGAWAGLIVIAVFSLFNAALHSLPHILAALLLAAMLMAEAPVAACRAPGPVSRYMRAALLLAAVAGVCALWLWTTLIPDWRLRVAEDIHVAGADPREAYEHALAWPWPAYEAHEEYAMALLDRDEPELAIPHLNRAREGIDTGRIWCLLGEAYFACEDFADAEYCLKECLFRWPRSLRALRLLEYMAEARKDAAAKEMIRNHISRWMIPADQIRFQR